MLKLVLLSIFTILLLLGSEAHCQKHLVEIKLEKLNKRRLFKILHSLSREEEPVWRLMHTDSLHKIIDTIEMTNSTVNLNDCFESNWRFLSGYTTEVQFARNFYLCVEPPSGARYTINTLKIEIIEEFIYISFSDLDSNLKDNFRVLKIDQHKDKYGNKFYWIKLFRMS